MLLLSVSCSQGPMRQEDTLAQRYGVPSGVALQEAVASFLPAPPSLLPSSSHALMKQIAVLEVPTWQGADAGGLGPAAGGKQDPPSDKLRGTVFSQRPREAA